VVPAKSILVACAFAAVMGLAGCGKPAPPAGADGEAAAQAPDSLVPPQLDGVRLTGAGVVLAGAAPAGAQVRLATPAGQAMFATADPHGRWTITLPPATEAQIFGLSANEHGRQVQAEGYVLASPDGKAALLRAGAAALRIDPLAAPGLRAIDFDRGGGVEVSAQVAAGATVIVHLDGRQAAEGRADAAGRYVASLGSQTAIKPGAHELQVSGDGFTDRVTAQLSPPAPLAQGPARSQLTPAGLRVDWLTPGGGVQSTLLVH
jgi:hypothetical protein